MKIELWPLARVQPYERNPRRNAAAVDAVAASINPRNPPFERNPMLETKLRELGEMLGKKGSQVDKLRFAALLLEIAALVEEAEQIDASVFEALGPEGRKAALALLVAVQLSTLQ